MSEPSNKGTSGAIVKAAESAAIALTHDTVKRYINAVATEQEVALFLNQCAMFGLNPFKREIYLIKYKNTEPATFVVGYEVYLKRAERTHNWAGMNSGVTFDKDGNLFSAWVDVFRKDWVNPLHHEVYLAEYIQVKDEWVNGQKTGKRIPTRFWAEKPITMLKKVAIAQAFRMAFPDEMGGMPYTAEEMPVEHSKLPTAEVVIDLKPGAGAQAQVGAGPVPLGNVRDEFTNPEDFAPKTQDEGDMASAVNATGRPAGLCTMDQVQGIVDGVGHLRESGLDESMVWRAIGKKVREQFGKEFGEPSDLTPEEAKWVDAYLKRWLKAQKAEKEGGKK